MASETSICNQALSWLGAEKIISIEDDTVNAGLCKDNYYNLRDSILQSASWTFATKRYKWIPVLEAPEWGYKFQFLIPSKVLRVVEARDDPFRVNGLSDMDWRVEEEYVVCDSQLIYVKCIIRITTVDRFSPLFIQSLAAMLAATLAPTITESNTKAQQMWALFDSFMAKAVPVDGSQGKRDRLVGRSLTTRVR